MKLIPICLLAALAGACSPDEAHAVDNTGSNERDRGGETLTPTDQSESDADRAITQDVRQTLMDAELSVNAKNIKVITREGRVTLRGVVESEAERNKIVTMAQALPGVLQVDDQLEVKTN